MTPNKTVRIEPTKEHPLPYAAPGKKKETFGEKIKTAAGTAEVLEQLAALPNVDAKTFKEEKALLERAVTGKDNGALSNVRVALGAAEFLRVYGAQLAIDVHRVRAALTNKLLELADHGDPRIELRAIELLGKHVDVGLFKDRSELTIKIEDPEQLQKQILQRVKRLMNADVIDEKPLLASLEEELRVKRLPEPIIDGEFTEVGEKSG